MLQRMLLAQWCFAVPDADMSPGTARSPAGLSQSLATQVAQRHPDSSYVSPTVLCSFYLF